MARSLARNTKVFVSTLVRGGGGATEFNATNATSENTFEIKVLDGYSFSQDVASQEVGVNEASSEANCSAAGLARGTLSFNTALNPVDVSFSTYVRPYNYVDTGDCVERILWSSAMGTAEGFSASPNTPATPATYNQDATADSITFSLATSNANELLPLTLMFVLENTTYVVEQFNIGTAEVDFSIDGIATINWSGNGSRVNEDAAIHNMLKDPGGSMNRSLVQQATANAYLGVPATTTQTFLRNKLSTLEIKNNELPNIDATLLAAAVTTVADTVMTLSGTPLVNAAHDQTVIRNTTQDQWDVIATNTTGVVNTINDLDATGGLGWLNSEDYAIYPMLGIDDATVSGLTIESTTAHTMVLDVYAGGRIAKIESDGTVSVYASILSNTTGGIITLAEAMPTGWVTGDEFIIFLPEQQAGVIYCIPITGATLSLENNITYLTPEELAIVNLPLAGFSGNRITSGSFTAYLNTGAQGSGGLLADLLLKIESSVSTNYELVFHMGGATTEVPRVDFTIAHANISIPTTNVEDIISTEISFTAKPWDTVNEVASFEDTNELLVAYFAVPE